MKKILSLCIGLAVLNGCDGQKDSSSEAVETTAKPDLAASSTPAPGAPGADPVWSFSGKTGIGTSYEQYPGEKNQTGTVSKVWFSIANGVLTETMYGLIHEAQLQRAEWVLVGEDYVDYESQDTVSEIQYLHKDEFGAPLSLAYKIVNTDKEKRYTIEKHIFTDPDRNSVYTRTHIVSKDPNLKAYFYANPHIANTGTNDRAWVEKGHFYASEGDTFLTVAASVPWQAQGVGFVGADANIPPASFYSTTGDATGNIELIGALPALQQTGESWQATTDIVFGFGASKQESTGAAEGTLQSGYEKVLAAYNGEGAAVGWEDYMASLDQLDKLRAYSTDKGHLLNASALVLKAQEDKTHWGALIASLSTPWGDTVSAKTAATGYKAVWPRDFYQCAMALLALGDKETPKVAFEYLEKVQVRENTPKNKGATGWFLQKSHVDGTLEWVGVQLDQTAMPIMLGWKLWQHEVLSDDEMRKWYESLLKPAADFLVNGGKVDIDWNQTEVKPPHTQQERWEEQGGYSPSTIASSIAGLVAASDIAAAFREHDQASIYSAAADRYKAILVKNTFTTEGVINEAPADGRYFLRITDNADPNDQGSLVDRNGQGEINESEILDGGFLELVRYGVLPPNDEHVLATLDELDNMKLKDELRVKYAFNGDNGERFYGWRRYGRDGYGEDAKTGDNYGEHSWAMSPGQRGRVWPFLTGERAHYELASAMMDGQLSENEIKSLRSEYVAALEYFANEGLMLPEQVWDGVGHSTRNNFNLGDGTNSATPLAWAHAEYVKLLKSLEDKTVWDGYPVVRNRYDH